jgi:hypothetical protein
MQGYFNKERGHVVGGIPGDVAQSLAPRQRTTLMIWKKCRGEYHGGAWVRFLVSLAM